MVQADKEYLDWIRGTIVEEIEKRILCEACRQYKNAYKRAYELWWKALDRERRREACRRWYAANKENKQMQTRKWYVANREHILERWRRRRAANREKRKGLRADMDCEKEVECTI